MHGYDRKLTKELKLVMVFHESTLNLEVFNLFIEFNGHGFISNFVGGLADLAISALTE